MTYCKKVWLIDDDLISIHLTENTLKMNNFSSDVRYFTNAQEALAELERAVELNEFPDFIFLDLNMPVLDGWDFLHAYRRFSKERKENCTLYILSSTLDENDINKSRLYEDVRDFLSKPLNKINLEIIKFQDQVH